VVSRAPARVVNTRAVGPTATHAFARGTPVSVDSFVTLVVATFHTKMLEEDSGPEFPCVVTLVAPARAGTRRASSGS